MGTCQKSDDTSTQPPKPPQEPKSKQCGGFAGLQCDKGYKCVITATHPDAMGTCQKSADSSTQPPKPPRAPVRKQCGGFAGLQCDKGYKCVITATHPDAMGTCEKSDESSGPCAKMKCKAGFRCVAHGKKGKCEA